MGQWPEIQTDIVNQVVYGTKTSFQSKMRKKLINGLAFVFTGLTSGLWSEGTKWLRFGQMGRSHSGQDRGLNQWPEIRIDMVNRILGHCTVDTSGLVLRVWRETVPSNVREQAGGQFWREKVNFEHCHREPNPAELPTAAL